MSLKKYSLPIFLDYFVKNDSLKNLESSIIVSSKKYQTRKMEVIRSFKKSSNFISYEDKKQ